MSALIEVIARIVIYNAVMFGVLYAYLSDNYSYAQILIFTSWITSFFFLLQWGEEILRKNKWYDKEFDTVLEKHVRRHIKLIREEIDDEVIVDMIVTDVQHYRDSIRKQKDEANN
jgi:hypothetical protein